MIAAGSTIFADPNFLDIMYADPALRFPYICGLRARERAREKERERAREREVIKGFCEK